MLNNMNIDYLIIGDGLSGLLLLQRILRDKLGSVLLISPVAHNQTLCSSNSQSFWSQGIVHKGYKYSLEGEDRPDLEKYADKFTGELSSIIDLPDFTVAEQVKVLADAASSLPSTARTSSGRYLNAKIKVGFFPELVVDSWGICSALRLKLRKHIYTSEIKKIRHKKGVVSSIELSKTQALTPFRVRTAVCPSHVFMCAGRHNGHIWHNMMKMPGESVQQLRPVVVGEAKHSSFFNLNAHLIFKKKWCMTVTSSVNAVGAFTWRFGGPLYDSGLPLKKVQAKTEKILEHFFAISNPSMNMGVISRAEKYAAGARILRPRRFKLGNVTIGWPVKMVMIPSLIDKMLRDVS